MPELGPGDGPDLCVISGLYGCDMGVGRGPTSRELYGRGSHHTPAAKLNAPFLKQQMLISNTEKYLSNNTYFGCLIFYSPHHVSDYLEDIGVDGRITLKLVLKKAGGVWNEFIWLRIGTSD
jgi:hypothetical protein